MLGTKQMMHTAVTRSGPRRSYGIVSGWVALVVAMALCLSTRLTNANTTPPLPVLNTNLIFDVTNTAFAGGALGDGVSNSAAAIQAAINTASASIVGGQTGGTVRVKAVGTFTNYLCGPINMASHVNLLIDTGTKLQMLPKSSWPSTTTFINGATLTDAEISGSGTIDGQGTNWWFPLASSRPNFIQFDHSKRVLIQDVTLQNPPTFTIYLKNSDTSVTIQRITINTPFDSHNTDGFDISSTNVLIQNSFISTGDDNVEIGGSGAAATDITISNCTFGTGHGLSMGSKIGGGVNNLIVSNCTWNGTEYGIKIKSDRADGGLVQNIGYTDLTMTNVNFPIAFYMNYDTMGSPSKSITITPSDAAADTSQSISSSTPIYRNIYITNLTAVGNSGTQGPGNIAGIIYGLPESPVTNVTLYKVNILGRGSDGTFCVYHARGINIVDSNLTAPTTGTNTLTIYNAGVTLTNSAANATVVTITGLGTPSNSVLSVFNGQGGTTDASVLGANPVLTLASSILTVSNSMSVGGSSRLNYGLATNATKTVVTGNLTLGGTLNVSDAGGFTNTTYTLFTYGGALTYNGLTLGTVPNTNFTYAISTNTLGQVNLIVSSGGGGTSAVASFTASPTNGVEPLPVTFTDTSTGTAPLSLFWNLGDSTTTNTTGGAGFVHTYPAGVYTVTLTASNSLGTSTLMSNNLITVLTAFQAWQIQYFGCTNCPQAQPDADPLGKGMSNTNQFLVGLNPTNPASLFKIISAVPQGNDVVVTWATAGAHTNAVQATSGDPSGGFTTNFTDLSGSIVIQGSGDATTNYTDGGGATNIPSRYYRIRLVP